MNYQNDIIWPVKYDLFGINVSSTIYEEAIEAIILACDKGYPAIVTHLPVHGLVPASTDPSLKSKINSFDIVAPDGQPVRWALNILYKKNLLDRCYGPELMLRLCGKAAELGLSIYLYGSHEYVIEKLKDRLMRQFKSLRIAGYYSPPFRDLTPTEDDEIANRINNSGASLIFLGLGFPKQDIFAFNHKLSINGVKLCVGAAFDFLSGNKSMAPKLMQRYGLEWFYRLTQEPNRLFFRYMASNFKFIFLFSRSIILKKLELLCR
jgi:N-acetylglucosaminyldiphosphoundecaprenol N-acetyl-beta-D-mannosaminyltransferase